MRFEKLIFEHAYTFNGMTPVRRVRTSLILILGLAFFPLGFYLISNRFWGGGFIVMTLAPCFLLYPTIRFFFGGKDSVAAVITTVVVEEVTKRALMGSFDKSKKKKQR